MATKHDTDISQHPEEPSRLPALASTCRAPQHNLLERLRRSRHRYQQASHKERQRSHHVPQRPRTYVRLLPTLP